MRGKEQPFQEEPNTNEQSATPEDSVEVLDEQDVLKLVKENQAVLFNREMKEQLRGLVSDEIEHFKTAFKNQNYDSPEMQTQAYTEASDYFLKKYNVYREHNVPATIAAKLKVEGLRYLEELDQLPEVKVKHKLAQYHYKNEVESREKWLEDTEKFIDKEGLGGLRKEIGDLFDKEMKEARKQNQGL